jgi:hypothetical protein
MKVTIIFLVFILPLFSILFFYLGRYVERIEWNKLIKDEILPKPLKTK